MTEPITVTFTDGPDRADQQDAAFYVGGGYDVNEVAIVSDGPRQVIVRCVGEMYVDVWETAEDKANGKDPNDDPIRYYADLVDEGITTDALLAEAEDRLEWQNNPWFELFYSDDKGYHDFGEVYHDLDDAVQAAIELLS